MQHLHLEVLQIYLEGEFVPLSVTIKIIQLSRQQFSLMPVPAFISRVRVDNRNVR